MMRNFTLIILFAICSTACDAQDSTAAICKDGISCKDAVLQLLPDYSFSYDTSFGNVRALVYKTSTGDEIQLFFDVFKRDGKQVFKSKSIVASLATMVKIYNELYKVKVTGNDLSGGGFARYKVSNGTLSLDKYDGWDGYWMLRLF